MSANNPNLREDLSIASPQRVPDAMREVKLGDLLAALIQQVLNGAKVQVGHFTATGASQALTFEQLGMVPPASATDYEVLAECETPGVSVDESTKTATGFTLLGTTNTQVINVIVAERKGPACQLLTVTSNAAVLSPVPAVVLDVVATAGTSLGRKVLKIGDSTISPAAGECVWDKSSGLRFNAADAVTAVRVVALPLASPLVSSMLNRVLGQKDAA